MKAAQQKAIIAALRDDLRAAIELRDRSFARRLDQDLVARGGRIIYALDSSIMNAHFSAHELARETGGRTTSGRQDEYQVFRGPIEGLYRQSLERRQAKVAQVMHSFLVEGRAGPGDLAQQLLLLPGHVEEAWNLYDTIVEQFAKQPRRIAKINDVAKQLSKVIAAGVGDGNGNSAEELSNALAQALFEIDAPHLKFQRFNNLLRRHRVLGLSAASQETAFQDRRLDDAQGKHLFVSPILEPDRPGRRSDDSAGSSSWWEVALTGRLPSIYLDSDRNALSTLDKLNRALDPDRVRVVLFTNNDLLIEAGAGYRPFKNSKKDFYGELSFSDLYLRHPRSLLVDSAFVRPHAETQAPRAASSDVDGWLDALLVGSLETPIHPGDRGYTEMLSWGERWLQFRDRARQMKRRLDDDTLLKKPLLRNTALHERFAHKWSTHLFRLTSDHILNAAGAETAIQELVSRDSLRTPEQVERVVEEAKARVRRLSEESWSDFFNTAADTGLELIGIPPIDAQTNVWPAAPLYARGHSPLSAPLHAFWWPVKLRDDASGILKQINSHEREESLQVSYVHALCYGLFFAYAGRWSLTKLLAQRAIQIARGIEASDDQAEAVEPITGREAYYLLSVAHRVTARTKDHYLDARAALKEAEKCVLDPIEEQQPPEPLSGLRFEAEAIAIDVGLAIADGGPDKELADSLRQRIRSALARATVCNVSAVRKLCSIALRSEFFLTLSFPGVKKLGRPKKASAVRTELSEELRNLIRQQIADLREIYQNLAWIPLRDRALLRLAAVTVGGLDEVPEELQESSLAALQHVDKANSIRSLDRRRLARIERIVSDRSDALPSTIRFWSPSLT